MTIVENLDVLQERRMRLRPRSEVGVVDSFLSSEAKKLSMGAVFQQSARRLVLTGAFVSKEFALVSPLQVADRFRTI